MNVSFNNLEDAIPVIPSRGVTWKKVWTLIALVITGTGTTVGTGAWAGIEKANKNAVLVQKVSLEARAEDLETQLEKTKRDFNEQLEKEKEQTKRAFRNELYDKNGELGLELRLQDINLALRKRGLYINRNRGKKY